MTILINKIIPFLLLLILNPNVIQEREDGITRLADNNNSKILRHGS